MNDLGTPFEYNPSVTNVNIDNQLAGILVQFNDDYIMDIVKDSLENRFRIYDLPSPNVVAAFESTFKSLNDGYESYNIEINETRRRVYTTIINIICDYYGFQFNFEDEDIDLYSAAFCLYDFFVCYFTEHLKDFYSIYLIREKESIYNCLDLKNIKTTEPTLVYSKKLFKDPKIAAIHCNIEYVIYQMGSFDISLNYIVDCVYYSNPSMGQYINRLIIDKTGKFFENYYQQFVINSKDSADILTYIKLALQQIGSNIEPIE